MINININDFIKAQRNQRIIKNITPECEVSPPLGTPEYDEWKRENDIKWAAYMKQQEENDKALKDLLPVKKDVDIKV